MDACTGKPENTFGIDGKAMGRDYTLGVIQAAPLQLSLGRWCRRSSGDGGATRRFYDIRVLYYCIGDGRATRRLAFGQAQGRRGHVQGTEHKQKV